MTNEALAFADAGIAVIPVRLYRDNNRWRKEPLTAWSLATTEPSAIERWWRTWPEALPGIPLRLMDWAVVDIDSAEGIVAVRELGCLGPHSSVNTPSGGKHLVFAQPKPPIAKHKWRDGVEILGTSSLLTAYDLEKLLFPRVAPRMVLPEIFRKPLRQGTSKIKDGAEEQRSRDGAVAVEVADLTAALWQLDARDWRGEYNAWFQLATACRFLGIGCADFVEWSTSDPVYAADARRIERIWKSTKPLHGGAFWAALAERGIKVTAEGRPRATGSSLYLGGTSEAATTSPVVTRDLRHRTSALLAWLARQPSEGALFSVACVFAEIIAEGRLKPSVAHDLLKSAAQSNGLWRELGAESCKRSIANGLRHVEEKLLQSVN